LGGWTGAFIGLGLSFFSSPKKKNLRDVPSMTMSHILDDVYMICLPPSFLRTAQDFWVFFLEFWLLDGLVGSMIQLFPGFYPLHHLLLPMSMC
jgi:hypothetical protein